VEVDAIIEIEGESINNSSPAELRVAGVVGGVWRRPVGMSRRILSWNQYRMVA
jgi:hypothetical protein